MIYVVCEDGGSGGVFLERLLNANLHTDRVTLVPSHGNKNLFNALKSIPNLGKGDRVDIALDNNGQHFLATVLGNIHAYCLTVGCSLNITTYFCIEELILSYTFVEHLGCCNDHDLLGLLYTVRAFVHTPSIQQGGYYTLSMFSNFKKTHNTKDREHLAFQLLNFILKQRRSQFKFEKGTDGLGSCWITNCADVIAIHDIYMCNRCVWNNTNMNALKKAQHFEANCMQPFYHVLI